MIRKFRTLRTSGSLTLALLALLAQLAGPAVGWAEDAKNAAPAKNAITLEQTDEELRIETDALRVRIRTVGYVSGTAAGGLTDKKTGAADIGFGLHVMDFLLAPGWRDDSYERQKKFHGDIPKHYVEGPQICTQAKKLTPVITRGPDWLAVQFRFTYTQAGTGYKAGSTWVQTLLFRPGLRYFLSSEAITSANDVASLSYRLDMPGHIRHKNGDSFAKVYLSYVGEIEPSEFAADFAPDEKLRYVRDDAKLPERMIRAYQVKRDGQPGPWLAGMTLDPAAASEGWCHQRGYICLIQELHGRPVKAGQTIGAAYVIGWFDDIAEMQRVYDAHKGKTKITLADGGWKLE